MQFHGARDRVSKRWILVISLSLIFVYAIFVFGIEGAALRLNAIPAAQIWHDADSLTSIDTVLKSPPQQWQQFDTMANFGITQGVAWIKVAIPNKVDSQDQRLLEITNPLLDKIDVWFFDNPHNMQLIDQLSVGDTYPYDERPYKHETFVFDFSRYETSPTLALMRVEVSGDLKLPMRIWQARNFLQYASKQRLAVGLFFGFLIAMAISNLFFYTTTKSISFLLYSAHVICFMLVCATLFGYGYEYLWSNNVWFQQRAIAVFSSLTLLFAMFFTNELLEVEQHSKKVSRVLKLLGFVLMAITVFSFVLPFYYLFHFFLGVLLVSVVLVSAICMWLSFKKVAIARYYNFAWSMMLICAVAAFLDSLGLFSIPGGISNTLLYGVAGETFLLAFVLALSYGSQGERLVKTQEIALAAEKESAEAKDKLLALEQQANDELEYKVQERTLELEITLRELSDANEELERLNTIDPLTSLRNRRYFDKRLVAEGRRSRREQTSLCLVMVDIDHFKNINDTYGHDVGDVCLQHIAKLAKSFIKRPSDDLCRYGGEEFVLILPNTQEEGAIKLMNDVRQAIESTPCKINEDNVDMTISVGVSSGIVALEQGEKAILKLADKALYHAKQSGRNQVCSTSMLEE